MAERGGGKALNWGAAQPPATRPLPPALGEAPWRALAGRELLIWRRHRRALVFWLGTLAGLMLWLETMHHILLAAKVLFKEYLGDCPLPAMTQISLGMAAFWDHILRPWAWLALLISMTWVIWHWRRQGAQLQAAGDWRRFCLAMSLAGPQSGPRTAFVAQSTAHLREPAIKAWVTAWLSADDGGPGGAATRQHQPLPPATLAPLLRQPGRPASATQWASAGQLLESHMNQQHGYTPLMNLLVYWTVLGMTCLTGYAWLGILMPFIKESSCCPGSSGW